MAASPSQWLRRFWRGRKHRPTSPSTAPAECKRRVGFGAQTFHFAETLAAELRLAAQGLLGNERVRSDGAGVNLVVHQVREFIM